MHTRAVYLLVVPGFADWEPAHAVAELRRHGGYRVEVVGLSAQPVESMGGLRVQPNRVLSDVDADDVAVFILPGGDRWETLPVEPELAALLRTLDAAGVRRSVPPRSPLHERAWSGAGGIRAMGGHTWSSMLLVMTEAQTTWKRRRCGIAA